MIRILYATIITLAILSILNSSADLFASELNSAVSITNNFTQNLKSTINNLGANGVNDTSNTANSSSMLTNDSNLTSSQVIISKNKVQSSMNSDGSAGGGDVSSSIKSKVTTTNGVCSSVKLGGNGDDTLSSAGNCNDELTGGPGADKFTCGEGNDTIKDYNSDEGDTILDKQNCEEIL